MTLPPFDDPSAKPPANILAFDSTRSREPVSVDLDSPFFVITRPEYPKCDHRNRGLWCEPGFPAAVEAWPDNRIAEAASSRAGIVVRAEDVRHVACLPGFITTMAMEPWTMTT